MAEEIMNWKYKSEGIDIIEVESETGYIEALAVGDLVKIERTGEYNADKCNVSVKIENKKLKLSAKSKKKWFWQSSKCKVGFKVTSPADKKLILKSGVGLIKVNNFSSGGEFSSGVGKIEFDNVDGNLKIRSGVGAIKGSVLSADVDIKSGAGNIDLRWNKSQEKGNISIGTGAGSAMLYFPEGTKMGIFFKAGAGSLNSEFGSDPESNFKIDFKSGAGNLNIKKK